MKITKTSSEAFEERKRRENANKGCNKCPCCGEPFVGITYKNLKVKGFFSVKMCYELWVRNNYRKGGYSYCCLYRKEWQ